MRNILTVLVILLALTRSGIASSEVVDVKTQVSDMSIGTRIEVRLNAEEKRVRGSRGDVSESGFAVIDSQGKPRQVAFDTVVSVKRYNPHIGRKILVGIGIVYLALVVIGSRL